MSGQMGKGKYGVRVNFSDFIKSKSFDYYYTMDEPWDNENYHFGRRLLVLLLINGVQVKWIDLTLLPNYMTITRAGNGNNYQLNNESFMEYIGDPSTSRNYFL